MPHYNGLSCVDFCIFIIVNELNPANFTDDQVIEATKTWVQQVVVAHNFCPFAAREVQRNSIRYTTDRGEDYESLEKTLLKELELLDAHTEIETTLIIYPTFLWRFRNDYLDWLSEATESLEESGYEGIYQIASFHPDYVFEGVEQNDPSHYTNRSPFPMIHLLREESIERAIASHENIDEVPEINIAKCREMGVNNMNNSLLLCYLSAIPDS